MTAYNCRTKHITEQLW